MTNSLRKLLVGGAVAGAVLGGAAVPAMARDGVGGETPFDVAASLSCDGTISWSAQVGTEELQQIWVKVDFFSTIALELAEVEGTYTGSTGGFDPFVAHSVLFRRLAGNDVEEQVIVDLAPCPVVVPPPDEVVPPPDEVVPPPDEVVPPPPDEVVPPPDEVVPPPPGEVVPPPDEVVPPPDEVVTPPDEVVPPPDVVVPPVDEKPNNKNK